jgi:diphosphate-dependent phosphofructokinase
MSSSSHLSGILDALPAGSTLIGFVGGTEGLFAGHSITITAEVMANYRGQGGFDLLGRSVDRLQGEKSYQAVTAACRALSLDGLVLLGGSKTATDAAYFAEYLQEQEIDVRTTVVCVPLTITGSIQNQFVEATVGFDTASKLTAQIVGNNQTDGASAKKYYYFQRLMGQEPSHLALEVALATKPNFTLIAEEIEQNNVTLADIVKSIADMVEERAARGKNYGSVVIPEGLIESIPEIKLLLQELDAAYASAVDAVAVTAEALREELTLWSRALLDSLPEYMQAQLLWQRTHANRIDISQAETERLLAHFVDLELKHRQRKGTYCGSFSVVCSFIGYQARGAMPSNFDVNYAYNLGAVTTVLIANDLSGYMATLHNLKGGVEQWEAGGVPITALMTTVPGRARVVVPDAKLDLQSASYQSFAAHKAAWAVRDCYENPGPLQFCGPTAHLGTETLRLESFEYLHQVRGLYSALARITEQCRPGCSSAVLHAATSSLGSLTTVLDLVCEAEGGGGAAASSTACN